MQTAEMRIQTVQSNTPFHAASTVYSSPQMYWFFFVVVVAVVVVVVIVFNVMLYTVVLHVFFAKLL